MFCRQDFVDIDHGLIDCATFKPAAELLRHGGIIWGRSDQLSFPAIPAESIQFLQLHNCSSSGGL
jgi:hypothetical protein